MREPRGKRRRVRVHGGEGDASVGRVLHEAPDGQQTRVPRNVREPPMALRAESCCLRPGLWMLGDECIEIARRHREDLEFRRGVARARPWFGNTAKVGKEETGQLSGGHIRLRVATDLPVRVHHY